LKRTDRPPRPVACPGSGISRILKRNSRAAFDADAGFQRTESLPAEECTPAGISILGATPSLVCEAPDEVVDIVRWPARHLHAKIKTHLNQLFFDLVERLSPEVRAAQHLGFAPLNEISDIDDAVVLEAIF